MPYAEQVDHSKISSDKIELCQSVPSAVRHAHSFSNHSGAIFIYSGFGKDIASGLQYVTKRPNLGFIVSAKCIQMRRLRRYLHSSGYIYNGVDPANILVNEFGTLYVVPCPFAPLPFTLLSTSKAPHGKCF